MTRIQTVNRSTFDASYNLSDFSLTPHTHKLVTLADQASFIQLEFGALASARLCGHRVRPARPEPRDDGWNVTHEAAASFVLERRAFHLRTAGLKSLAHFYPSNLRYALRLCTLSDLAASEKV
jgi:hypothetical protein